MAGIWFFVTDISNEFRLFDMPMQWYAVMGPVMLLFGLQEAVFDMFSFPFGISIF